MVAAILDEDSVIHGTATKPKLRLVYEGDRGDLALRTSSAPLLAQLAEKPSRISPGTNESE